MRVAEGVDDSLETIGAQVDDDFDVSGTLIDDIVDEAADPAVVDGDTVYELEATDAEEETLQAGNSVTEEATVEYSDRSGMDVSDNKPANQSLQAVVDDEDAESDSAVVFAEGDVVCANESSSDVSVDARRRFVDADDSIFEDAVESDAKVLSKTEEVIDAVDEQAVLDEIVEGDSDHSTGSNDESTAVGDTLIKDDYAFVEKCRGRGGFDLIPGAQYAETCFARYRRSVAGLVAFIVITIIIAAFVGGWT